MLQIALIRLTHDMADYTNCGFVSVKIIIVQQNCSMLGKKLIFLQCKKQMSIDLILFLTLICVYFLI